MYTEYEEEESRLSYEDELAYHYGIADDDDENEDTENDD